MLGTDRLLKKAGSLLLCLLMTFSVVFFEFSVPASATENTGTAEAELPRLSDEEYIPAKDWPQAPWIGAEAAVLIEADSGKVLYAKNADSKRYPASITKILTALITIENSKLSDRMIFKGEALNRFPSAYVSIHPTEGEEMSVEDCLNGLLLDSANDAANALAVHNAGTLAAFAEKMNKRAAEAGATHTHFVNPSGYADEDHYTTPYDMAMIMRACIKEPDFLKIAGSLSYTIPATNKHAARYVEMRHQMLKPGGPNYYAYCKAGKTGFTTPSGFTLVTYAEKDGVKLISCVMQCGVDGVQYSSTRALLDYGFDNFRILSGKTADEMKSFIDTDSFVLNQIQRNPAFAVEKKEGSPLILPADVTAEELEGRVRWTKSGNGENSYPAELTYLYEGKELGTTRMRLKMLRTDKPDSNPTGGTEENLPGDVRYLIFMYACLAGIVLVIALFAAVMLYLRRKNRRKALAAVSEKEDKSGDFEKEENSENCGNSEN
ncbi:MAG: D-alanyl-D-alanine carboxypeptidase family protein, partial [Lachnospiraceae bacterium]|nr:D-alanyl-D-alanine carboxypeptidase family protein [Lachnospiraceae bacterium]